MAVTALICDVRYNFHFVRLEEAMILLPIEGRGSQWSALEGIIPDSTNHPNIIYRIIVTRIVGTNYITNAK